MKALAIASRVLAAVAGGYALAAAIAASAATALPGQKAEAALIGIMLGFVAYTGAMIWAFAARSAWRAWIGLMLPTGLLGLVAWIGTIA